MGDVVDIDAHKPHVTGGAQCRLCGKSWQAVIREDANLWLLECPSCHQMAGWMMSAVPDSPHTAKVWMAECFDAWVGFGGVPLAREVMAEVRS